DQLVENEVTRHFNFVTRTHGWQKLFPTIIPLPKGPAPLQAVDMLAYEGGRHSSEHDLWTGTAIVGRKVRPPQRSPRALYEALNACPQIMFATLSMEGFISIAKASVQAGDR